MCIRASYASVSVRLSLGKVSKTAEHILWISILVTSAKLSTHSSPRKNREAATGTSFVYLGAFLRGSGAYLAKYLQKR